MRKQPTAKHVPDNLAGAADDGAAMRQRAAESCGHQMGVDLFDARREIEAGGGAEKVLDRVVRRIERGQQ